MKISNRLFLQLVLDHRRPFFGFGSGLNNEGRIMSYAERRLLGYILKPKMDFN